MSKKLTKWFPAQVAPARVGPYEVRDARYSPHASWFSYWDGSHWLSTTWEPGRAQRWGAEDGPSSFQRYEWRGLAEQPKGSTQ